VLPYKVTACGKNTKTQSSVVQYSTPVSVDFEVLQLPEEVGQDHVSNFCPMENAWSRDKYT